MLYACEMVPKLKSRQVGGVAASHTVAAGSGGGKTNKKKKR